MNKEEQRIAGNITKAYGIDIEKGRGKTKKIGELDKSGKNIKTANGWVPVKQHNVSSNKEEITPKQNKESTGRSYEEIKSDIIDAKQYIKNDRITMEEMKAHATKDIFNAKHVAGYKESYEKMAKSVKHQENDLENLQNELHQSIGNEPLNLANEEEAKKTMHKIFMGLGYTAEDLKPGFPYDNASFKYYAPDRKWSKKGDTVMHIDVPKQYDDISIHIDKKGYMTSELGPKEWGIYPDKGSMWQHGTSGQNNPAPTSEWPTERRKVNKVKDVVNWLNEMRDVAHGKHSAQGKDFADYLRAGGSYD
tara:strand:+ start:1772 stop:2689 length:918 start_codon:yes stop_codon:yes gene_type:complete